MSEKINNIPQDNTWIPGMKMIMGDCSDCYNVKYIPNVEYVVREEEALKLQMLLPELPLPGKSPRELHPLVVYVQGAAWGEQDCYINLPELVDVARAGYVVASVKHRSSAVAKFPAFLQDVKSAIRFLRANATQYCIDSERVAVWGDSSGGNAALLAGMTGDFEEFKTEDNKEQSDSVDVIVDFYGPTDVTRINDKPRMRIPGISVEEIPENIVFGGDVLKYPELARRGNPITYISESREIPPILIMHGDWDSVVPFNQSVLLYEELVKCDKVVEFFKIRGAEHGMFFWSETVIDTVLKFLGIYL